MKTYKSHVLVLLYLTFIFLFLTFPLILNFNSILPGHGDTRHLSWVMAWDIHQLFHDPLHMFDANILYNTRYILASADHLIGSAIMGMPVYLLTGNLPLLYNTVYLLGFVLSGFAMYLLVRYCTGNTYAAVVAATFYAFLPYRFRHLTHPHMFNTIWIPLAFLFLDKFLRSRKGKDCALFILFYTLTVLSSWYLGLYLSVLAPIYLLAFIILGRRWRILKTIVPYLLIGAILAGLVILPFAYPYLYNAREHGFDRELASGANLKDYYGMVPFKDAWYRKVLHLNRASDYPFFLGMLAYFLMALALISFRKGVPGSKRWEPPRTSPLLLFIIVGLAAFLFSFGKDISYGNTVLLPGPYRLLHYFVPGFSGLRRAGRFAMLYMTAAGVIIGFGYVKLEEWVTKMKKFSPAGLCIIASLIIMSEVRAFYIKPTRMKMTFVTPEAKPYAVWLEGLEDDPVILNLPMHDNMGLESGYMIDSIHHWRRMVNGYTAFVPKTYHNYRRLMREYPSEEGIAKLKQDGITYILLHAGEYEVISDFEEALRSSREIPHLLEYVGRFETVYVFKIK